MVQINLVKNFQHFAFENAVTKSRLNWMWISPIHNNNVFAAKAMCQQGHGIARILYLDTQKDLLNGSLLKFYQNGVYHHLLCMR